MIKDHASEERITRLTLKSHPHREFLIRETKRSKFWVFRKGGQTLIHDFPFASLEEAKAFADADAPSLL